MAIKILYFDFPGRAEVARLALTYGNVPFEDVRLARDEWAKMKPTTPFGQLPVMELDGEMIAQSAGIDRYAAARAGLLPSDPAKAAKAEQWYFLMSDINQLFYATFRLATLEEKLEARKPIIEGPFHDKMTILDKYLADKEYLLGSELSYADFAVFIAVCMWKSGFMDGLTAEHLEKYPNVKAYRNRIASLELVKAYYSDKEGLYNHFKPE